MRPSHQILGMAINELLGSRASLIATFRRPGGEGPARAFVVTAEGSCGFTVRTRHAPPAHPTSPAAAIALMSRDGRLALEKATLCAPGQLPFPWFGPAAGFVDSSEPKHAAATTIQRAFIKAAAGRRRRVRDFQRAFVTAATETCGAGRLRAPLRLPSSCMTL